LAYVDRFPPWVNAGAEWYLHALFVGLVARGHRCTVITQLPVGVTSPQSVDGITVLHHAAAHGAVSDPLLDDLADSVDVLIGHLLWTKQVVHMATAHQLPLIYILHNDMQVSHWHLTANNVTAIAYNSRWVHDSVQHQHPGLDVTPGIVCRPPVRVADYQLDDDAFRREWVTMVNPNEDKGGVLFWEIAKRFHRRLFVAVEGAYGTQIRPPMTLSNGRLVSATANMRDDIYARTRVLCVPSRYESWGMVAVEAMCAGIPVVAHPTPGLVEACGDAALFCDRDDPAAWAEIVGRLMSDHKFHVKQAEQGRARAAELDGMAVRDIDGFEDLTRRCAGLRCRI
jgi:glycosyltransferase involved in cell wall biosynthesis